MTPPGSPDSIGPALKGGARGPYVLTSTPPRPKVRKPTWHRRLVALEAKPHGLSGLKVPRTSTDRTGRVLLRCQISGVCGGSQHDTMVPPPERC